MPARSIVSPDDQPVTFVELFFDLVFVFSVTQLLGLFQEGIGWATVGEAVLIFWLVRWAWTQFTCALTPPTRPTPRSWPRLYWPPPSRSLWRWRCPRVVLGAAASVAVFALRGISPAATLAIVFAGLASIAALESRAPLPEGVGA